MFLIPFIGFLYLLRKWFIIVKNRTSFIKDVKPGMVELKGNAIPWGSELISPLMNIPCVRYRTRIYRYIEGYYNDQRYTEQKNVWEEERGSKFILTDGTGSVRVDPRDHQFDMKQVFHYQLKRKEVPPWPIERFLSTKPRRFGAVLRTLSGPFYFEESLIPIGQEIYVLGSAERIPPKDIRLANEKTGDLQITKRGDFFLSLKGEKGMVFKYKWGSIGLLAFSAAILGFYIFILLSVI